MNFLEKISFMMDKLNINKSKLSEISGVPYTTIDSFYKKGYENTKLSTIRKIATALNVSVDYLVDDSITNEYYGRTDGFQFEYNEMQHIKKYRTLDEYGQETVTAVLDCEYKRCKNQAKTEIAAPIEADIIPLLEPWQAASAGYGQYANDETAEVVYVYRNSVTAKADYIMRVVGRSMEPKLFDGQRVLVKAQPRVELGEIGLFIVGGERFVKIYRGDHLESSNSGYPNIQLDESSICTGKVLGILEEEWIAQN